MTDGEGQKGLKTTPTQIIGGTQTVTDCLYTSLAPQEIAMTTQTHNGRTAGPVPDKTIDPEDIC